ncbi:MAG: chitobiase/beta-hexosaminidase C-terminal domain-containing protein [Terracidiphilus sp.]
MNYSVGKVNDQAFQSAITFVPNGWNISFVLQNNTSLQGAEPDVYGLNAQFSSGAGCEGSIFQAFPNGLTWDPPNNIFALILDQKSPLTDGNATTQGGGGYPGTFTYSNIQLFGQGMDPCNPRDGTEVYYYFTKRVSTSPVPLNSPAGTVNTSTGDNYSWTVTFTGSNVTAQLYDITAGGSCPGASCFTYTWNNVFIPSMVDGTTAWVGIASSTNAPSGYPLLINTFAYTVLSAADTPTFSPAAGTYGTTQSVTISDGSSNSIICYNTTGNPSTNGVGGCASGTLYSGAVSVAKGQTLYAVAGSGTSSYGDSAVGSAAYNITGYASAPMFSASSGAYQGNQTIILAAAHGGVICYNTSGSPATNGTTGCTTGTLYTGPITVSSNETLYAIAGGSGFTDSPISSAAYAINQFWGTYGDSPMPPATPTFSPLPGAYTGTQNVTLASTTSGANICYALSLTPLAVPPFPDSAGGCTVGTLYTGPVAVSSSQILYAIAGTNWTTYSYCDSGGSTCSGTSSPSTLTAGAYTINAASSGAPGAPTNVTGSVVPQ